jgi:hypothetical protein
MAGQNQMRGRDSPTLWQQEGEIAIKKAKLNWIHAGIV